MYIILNADDLGRDININNTIFNLMSRNIVNSATILANGLAFEDAINNLYKYPGCSFGVHLNLTEFRPLTSNSAFKEIVDENGYFNGKIRYYCITSSYLRTAIFNEWCSQIDKIQAYGVTPSHIDSHHHVHTIPSLFPVLKNIQKKYGIRKVRMTKNIFSSKLDLLSDIKKCLWNLCLRNYYRTKTTSGFTDFSTFLYLISTGQILHNTVELMVHPGNANYEAETKALKSNWIETMPINITLINYNDL